MNSDKHANTLTEMKQRNNAVKDSLSRIIAQLSFQDSLYKIERDSLRNRLAIIQALSVGLNSKMAKITNRIEQNIGTSWDELTPAQKDSIVASVKY